MDSEGRFDRLREREAFQSKIESLKFQLRYTNVLLREVVSCKNRHVDMELHDIIKKHLENKEL